MDDQLYLYHPRRPGLAPVRSTLNSGALRTIIEAIHEAWSQIDQFDFVKSAPFDVEHWNDEDELSVKLIEILNDRLDNNLAGAFRKEVFQTVTRDAKQSTATTDSHDQMPDLTFRMVQPSPGNDRDESALFVEAKLLDGSSGCREYVVNGLYRFVSGRYAPRVTFGMMLGYTVPKFSNMQIHLPAYFNMATSHEAQSCKADITPSEVHSECCETQHVRKSPCPERFRALHVWVVRRAAGGNM